MNKDVIYIEPEDDITDIITKIENSKEKIIAIVPPKKAGVFRSIVNIKLIAKAGVNAGKTIVLVTTDPSIIKLAATTKLPVTKNLQSAPEVPKMSDAAAIETTSEDELLEAAEGQTEEAVVETVEEEAEEKETAENEKDSESKKEDGSKKDVKGTDGKKKKSKLTSKQRKIIIGVSIGAGVLLILLLVWAFGIAPAAHITVAVRTTTTNFSENATFTKKLAEEDVTAGKFYLDEKKSETKVEANFDATGSKDVGEKAKGEVVVYAYFREKGNLAIEKGATFSNNGLKFVADEDTTLSWDEDADKCENDGLASAIASGCLISKRVKVTATEPGEKYNIAATTNGWGTTANVGVYSDSAMSGGTTKNVIVVQKSDVDKALAKIVENNTSSQAARKTKLLSSIEEGSFIIESSYKQSISDPVSTPAVGEEVEPGKKATISVTITDSIYMIDKTKVEEFITEKAKLADNYKIYEMNDPFIENFTEVGETYIGKIKTSFVSGPKVTENEVVDVVKGKGLGEARKDLLDKFSGIDSNKTKIEVSYPWVFSVPSEVTKITVTIDVEE